MPFEKQRQQQALILSREGKGGETHKTNKNPSQGIHRREFPAFIFHINAGNSENYPKPRYVSAELIHISSSEEQRELWA